MTPNDNSLTPADMTEAEGQRDGLTTLRPTRAEAEAAIDVLIRWLGEDPSREGLRDTPARVVRAWEEFCSGYDKTRLPSCRVFSKKSKAMTTW